MEQTWGQTLLKPHRNDTTQDLSMAHLDVLLEENASQHNIYHNSLMLIAVL